MNQICKKWITVAAAVLVTAMLPCSALAATSMARDVSLRDSYFDDAVFVGDSISLKLKNYVAKQRRRSPGFLGRAQFLTVGGLGSGNVQLPITPGSLHPEYEGEKMMLEDSVAATGAKKMYIMFGMNDIVPYGVDGAVENLETLIDKILEKSPDLIVAVESVTPILVDKQQKNLNNSSIAQYNQALQELCDRRGFQYLDVGSQLMDDNGGLAYEYCGDAPGLGMHLSDAGCVPWVEFLRSHPITETEDSNQDVWDEESIDAWAQGDSFGMEEDAFVDYDPEEEPVLPARENDGGQEIDVQKKFALEVTGADKGTKVWKPKTKGRMLN